ncbi:MAG: hypothetical protein ACD_75C01860G0002 [uncultured bacterium]|nr:MAG: hypothetical protein ACD_75C01860G0002 [uncultured bacterium]HBG21391.1 hypothetical protein [Desulfobulbaceae bacterium]
MSVQKFRIGTDHIGDAEAAQAIIMFTEVRKSPSRSYCWLNATIEDDRASEAGQALWPMKSRTGKTDNQKT